MPEDRFPCPHENPPFPGAPNIISDIDSLRARPAGGASPPLTKLYLTLYLAYCTNQYTTLLINIYMPYTVYSPGCLSNRLSSGRFNTFC